MADTRENVKKLSEDEEILNVLFEISNLLNTGLDRESLACCVKLCENGVNPEGLAHAIKEVRQGVKNINVNEQT